MSFKIVIFVSLIIWVQLAIGYSWRPGIPKSFRAAWGRDVCLPCGGNPIALDGPNAYIQWLKDDAEMVRRDDTIPTWCSVRGSLRFHINENDIISESSDYRCRVHYQYAPPVDFLINLTYIEPPEIPRIYNERNEEVTWGYVGPYITGSRMRLLCHVAGGKPEPQVTWRRNGELLGMSENNYLYHNPIVIELVVNNMTREEFDVRYECLAMNSVLSEPLRSSVVVKMYLPPVKVTMTITDKNIIAGQVTAMECTVVGSFPPPTVTWYIGTRQIAGNYTEEEQADGNVTISTIKFKAMAAHHKQILSCFALNPYLRTREYEDSIYLDVQHPPILNISMVDDNITEIVENDTIRLKCSVDASPRPYKVVWNLNGYKDIITNIPETNPLYYVTSIVNMKRSSSGTYTCMASNVLGDSESNALNIIVAYKPICVQNKLSKYGIVQGELETLSCTIESIPTTEYFMWSFPNSKNMRTISRKMLGYEHRYVSTLTFKPDQDDFGLVACYGINKHGQQTTPCLLKLVQGGPPDSLTQCHVTKSLFRVIDVVCHEGYDGGRHQTFTMLVFYKDTGDLVTNVTAEVPHMRAVDLQSETQYVVHVYASNSRGRSKIVKFEASTMTDYNKIEERQQPSRKITWRYWNCFPIITGLCTLLMVICIFLVSNKRCTTSNSDLQECHEEIDTPNPDLIPLNEGIFHREPRINNFEAQSVPSHESSFSQSRIPDLMASVGEHSFNRSCRCFQCLLEDASLSAMSSAPSRVRNCSRCEPQTHRTPRMQNNLIYEV